MLKLSKYLILLFIGLFVGVTKSEAGEPSFSVEPVLSSKQINNEHTYFDLKVEPNEKETLSVKVHNYSKRELIIVGEVNRATTSDNGLVEYGKADNYDEKLDDNLQYNIKELVRPKTAEIKIPAEETVTYEFEIVMPNTKVNGILAGGLSFREKELKKVTEKKETTGLKSKINYKVGLIINGTDDRTKPELQFLKVFSNTVSQVNSIGITLKNNHPEFINELVIAAKITEDKTKKVIYSGENNKLQMAPNSHFDYSVFITDTQLPQGTYTIDVTASSGEQSWQETKQLSIGEEGITSESEFEAVGKPTSKNNTTQFLLFVLIGLVVLVISLIVIVVILKRNKGY